MSSFDRNLVSPHPTGMHDRINEMHRLGTARWNAKAIVVIYWRRVGDYAGDLRKISATASYGAVTPAKAGVQETSEKNWVPAFAGTTDNDVSVADEVLFVLKPPILRAREGPLHKKLPHDERFGGARLFVQLVGA